MQISPLGPALKKYRQLNRMSVQDVALELSSQYNLHFNEKTIYGWESNQSRPSSDTFIALCNIYRITNVQDFFNEMPDCKEFYITAEERTILESYRTNKRIRKLIRDVMDLEEEPEEKKSSRSD